MLPVSLKDSIVLVGSMLMGPLDVSNTRIDLYDVGLSALPLKMVKNVIFR